MKGLVANPEDWLVETTGLIERGGGKLIDYYITFGEYDFVVIYSAPSPVAAFSIAAVGGAGGSRTDTKTTVGLTSAEAGGAMSWPTKTPAPSTRPVPALKDTQCRGVLWLRSRARGLVPPAGERVARRVAARLPSAPDYGLGSPSRCNADEGDTVVR